MKNYKIINLIPNYRKKVLEATLALGKKVNHYDLPFSTFKGLKIGTKNPFAVLTIEKELNSQSASFVLKDGSKGDFPADFVLYHCDPGYDWSPINQLKKTLKDRLREANISVRVLANALETSASQVERLLEIGKASKQLIQLSKAAEIAGYQLEFKLKGRRAA